MEDYSSTECPESCCGCVHENECTIANTDFGIEQGMTQTIEQLSFYEKFCQSKFKNGIDRQEAIAKDWEQLTARVRELEEENARLNSFMPTDCSNLTIRKTKSIFTDAGSTYKPSGFVLTGAEGKKCIVDMSTVRWMNGNDFFSTMYSDSTMAQQLAASQAYAEQLREEIEALWGIIDDIDSYGDMAKADDKLFRSLVEKRQKDRWETGITTDGYVLNMPTPPRHKRARCLHCGEGEGTR